MDDLHGRLADLLSSSPKKTPKLFISHCVMHELQSMGLTGLDFFFYFAAFILASKID